MTERLESSPLAVGAMLGCIVLAAARLVGMVARIGDAHGWYPAYLIGACALAVAEAYYGRRLRRRWDRSVEGPDGWKLVALEVLVFVVLLKLGSYAGDSLAEIWADVQSWAREPARIVDGETCVAFILASLSWLGFTQTLVDLEHLSESPEFWSDAQSGALGRPVPQVRLTTRFLWGGVVLLVLTGLIGLGANLSQGWAGAAALWSAMFAHRDASAALVPVWPVVNVLAYFGLGLVMASRVRFVALRQDWMVQKTAVARGLGKTWWRYSLAFVGLAAMTALLLPTGYTAALLDVLRYGLAVVLQTLYRIAATLLVLVSLPLFMLAEWYFGKEMAAPRAPPLASVRPPALPASSGGPAWLGMVRAVFFWLLLFGLAVYLVRSFLREHPEIPRSLASFRPLRWLLRLWEVWRARFAHWQATRARLRNRGGVGVGQTGSEALLSEGRAPDSNRGRVRYYYVDMVRRARRAGYPREPAQTPRVYGTMLEDKLPETRDQVDLLTDSFIEARYSRHPIETNLVRRVRAGWQQLKQLLGGYRGHRD